MDDEENLITRYIYYGYIVCMVGLCIFFSLISPVAAVAKQVMITLIVNNLICISNSFQQFPKINEYKWISV